MKTVTTSFLIVRHGESVANAGGYYAGQNDSPLSELGLEQARRLTEGFAHAPVHAVYASDLSRARDTVAAIASTRGLPLVETALLRERDMGVFTGRTFDDIRGEFPDLFARTVTRDPDAAPPGGETHAAMAARAAKFFDGLPERHAGQTVVIGSHGGIIQHLVRELLGVRDLRMPVWVASSNGGVTRVELYETAPGVRGARIAYANRVLPSPNEPLLP